MLISRVSSIISKTAFSKLNRRSFSILSSDFHSLSHGSSNKASLLNRSTLALAFQRRAASSSACSESEQVGSKGSSSNAIAVIANTVQRRKGSSSASPKSGQGCSKGSSSNAPAIFKEKREIVNYEYDSESDYYSESYAGFQQEFCFKVGITLPLYVVVAGLFIYFI